MLFASSENDANLFYAVRFIVPDPFLFFQIQNKKFIIMSDLELARAQKQAQVDEVLSYSKLVQSIQKSGLARPRVADVAAFFLKKMGVTQVHVPSNFNLGLAQELQLRKIQVNVRPDPFFEERAYKVQDEIKKITQTLRWTEEAIKKMEGILRKSKIQGKFIIYQGQKVTSEFLKRVINVALMEHNCVGSHTIVASGDQGCDPHCEGTGLVWAHQSLVVDVFPRSGETMYFADITRTFVKGHASSQLKQQYQVVLTGQQKGISLIKAGVNGKHVHSSIQTWFEQQGFHSEKRKGVPVGFFHGTGHGLGLDVHEFPRINSEDHWLKEGEVVTVEPGLYYPKIGAVRLEDVVVVTSAGNENLTQYPKQLEIA
jgi:Xaa-Pro aminopeptidase